MVVGVAVPAAWHGAWTASLAGALVTLLAVAPALTAVFVALAFCIAVRCEDKVRGLAIAMAVWMASPCCRTSGAAAGVDLRRCAARASGARRDARESGGPRSRASPAGTRHVGALGYTGAVFAECVRNREGVVLATAALALWVAVPGWLGGRAFVRKDF